MTALQQGAVGEAVRRWQAFLVGRRLLEVIDGDFGPATLAATMAFQSRCGLAGDGVVGGRTVAEAVRLGFSVRAQVGPGDAFPPEPDFRPLAGNQARAALFGAFSFQRTMGDRIRIFDGWEERNVVTVEVPQLRGVEGATTTGRVRFHRKVADQVVALFAAWEAAGLRPLILTWAGSFVPRFVRGSRTSLSNHAWGTAFDINAAWNPLGAVPAGRGREGSVRDLVPIAHQHGFYWGGHFERSDGMHFEVARIV